MTYAPRTLVDARRYLIDALDMHPGRDVPADLDPDEVGIVAAGWGHGYHRGRGSIDVDDDYSVRESSRDRRGLSDAASALDIGEFDVVIDGRHLTLRHLNAWLVGQCEAGAPGTGDIREVIYTLDGKRVLRWDRLGIRSSGDSSHLWHTHISYHRDSESRDKATLFRRYVTGSSSGGDDMDLNDKLGGSGPHKDWTVRRTLETLLGRTANELPRAINRVGARVVALEAVLGQVSTGTGHTPEQLVAAAEEGVRRALGDLDES